MAIGSVTATSPDPLAVLQTIYGAHVPADTRVALEMLATSPFAPVDPASAATLRELVIAAAGQGLDGMREAAERLRTHGTPPAVTHKPLGPLAQLHLDELARRNRDQLTPVISEARAAQLFAELAAASDIPHDFVDEGCHFRAHVMAKRLEEAGVTSDKVILVPTQGDLRIDSAKAALGFTVAMFHTATSVSVRSADGRVERRVLDPSLCDVPVSLETWTAKMRAVGGAPCELLFLPRFALMPWERDNPPSTWRQEDLDDARRWNEQYTEVQKMMRETGFYEHLQELVEGGTLSSV